VNIVTYTPVATKRTLNKLLLGNATIAEKVFPIWPALKLRKYERDRSRTTIVLFMTTIGLLDDWKFGFRVEFQVEFTVSEEWLWLRHGNSSGTQKKGNVYPWKPVPEDWKRDSRQRRLISYFSEMDNL
jgi:hypothetical protein